MFDHLNRVSSPPPGAVVVGGDYQGLGIVRSLGRHGIRVIVIDDEFSIARYSRFADKGIRVPDLRDEETTINTLLHLAEQLSLNGWVLFATRDETVAALARNRDKLARWFRVPTPSWDTVRWIWDKRNTHEMAERLGIPVPRSWRVRHLRELDAIDCRFPVAIKPSIKEHFFYRTKVKAWRANSRADLVAIFGRLAAIGEIDEVMVQDLIPGGGECQFAFCALFKNGHALASMVARRERQHPPEFGRASTFVSTADVPELEELSIRFLRTINYYGLVEMEYKLDRRDGEYKLLDVNGRTWGYHSIGYRAGVDFPYLLFSDQLGESVKACRSQAGIRWVRLLTDIPTGVIGVRQRAFAFTTYIRSLLKINTEAVFSLEDPVPGIAELALAPYLAVKRGF